MNSTAAGRISGISTWQKGGYIPAPRKASICLRLQYAALVAKRITAQEPPDSIGSPTYFGTDENIPIRPVLTCNPTSGLTTHQVLNGKCFNAPAVGTQGGNAWPYMK